MGDQRFPIVSLQTFIDATHACPQSASQDDPGNHWRELTRIGG
jgi:hypothetical protein